MASKRLRRDGNFCRQRQRLLDQLDREAAVPLEKLGAMIEPLEMPNLGDPTNVAAGEERLGDADYSNSTGEALLIPGGINMPDFVPNNNHFREVLIFLFKSNKTAAEAHRQLKSVYGAAGPSESRCREWFRRFKSGDFDVADRPREGRPKTFEDVELRTLLEADPCQTQEELASMLGVSRQAISKRLCAFGMVQEQGSWVYKQVRQSKKEEVSKE